MGMYNPDSDSEERAAFGKRVCDELTAYAEANEHPVDAFNYANWALGARCAWDIMNAEKGEQQ